MLCGHELTSLPGLAGSSTTAGDGHSPWSVADVTELPLTGKMAARFGETAGEAGEAPP